MNLTTELLKEGKYVFLAERLRAEKKKANHPPAGNYSFGKVSKKKKTVSEPSLSKSEPSLSKKEQLLIENPNCYYCNVLMISYKTGKILPQTSTIDHLTPLSRGGKRTKDNEVLCCSACNTDKGRLTEGEYLAVLNYRKSL